MSYSHIRTLSDYLIAVSVLNSNTAADDYSDRARELADFAQRALFKAKKLQLTGAGHREYRVEFSDLSERVRNPDSFVPVILTESLQGYEPGSRVNIPLANHLDDEIAA